MAILVYVGAWSVSTASPSKKYMVTVMQHTVTRDKYTVWQTVEILFLASILGLLDLDLISSCQHCLRLSAVFKQTDIMVTWGDLNEIGTNRKYSGQSWLLCNQWCYCLGNIILYYIHLAIFPQDEMTFCFSWNTYVFKFYYAFPRPTPMICLS